MMSPFDTDLDRYLMELRTLSYPDRVRRSCALYSTHVAPPLVEIDQTALERFARDLDVHKVKDFSAASMSTNDFGQEIVFQSDWEEAGFIMLAHALDFGSGFRKSLHRFRGGQGAWLTIRAGLVRLGQRDSSLSVSFLQSLSLGDIQELFDLCPSPEAEFELIGLAQQIYEDIQEIASVLSSKHLSLVSDYIQQIMLQTDFRAPLIVGHLVEDFPLTFRDEYMQRGDGGRDWSVCLYKKAQLVVSELSCRFNRQTTTDIDKDKDKGDRPHVRDVDLLTAFVDNVVVATLRAEGVLLGSAALITQIESEECVHKGSGEELALRCTALHAIEKIVALRPDSGLTAQILCNYLWGSLGKEPAMRRFRRHLCPSTSFY